MLLGLVKFLLLFVFIGISICLSVTHNIPPVAQRQLNALLLVFVFLLASDANVVAQQTGEESKRKRKCYVREKKKTKYINCS